MSFEEPIRRIPGTAKRDRSVIPNAMLVARREFRERVRSRLFVVSTILLALLAVGVSLTPVFVKIVDRGVTTRIAVVSDDTQLASSSIQIIGGILNGERVEGQEPPYTFIAASTAEPVTDQVSKGVYDGALIANRLPSGQLTFQFLSGERMGADRVQLIQVGALAVSIFDWVNSNNGGGGPIFQPGVFETAAVGGGGGSGGQTIDASEYAGRRIVGVVFVVLIFITLVIYGMWVAAGVVAEKTSRVMELLISAATPSELLIGKVVGIGLAGLVQYVAILVPALFSLFAQDRIATALLGDSSGLDVSLGTLTPWLLAAYGAFWILGFTLYALIYAAAGSLVSRAEDLQVLALPLSLVAIAGYLQAVMALSGGIGPLVRLSSYIPFWSPFVMLTRLTVGRVEPWELALSFGLLAAAIPIVGLLAVRVYSAGVLLYGQRPGARQIVAAIARPPV